jgi:3-methyl-2-oxobutanoate hydroxymethyltransferase
MTDKPGEAITTAKLIEMKQKGVKIAALTAYDTPTARLLNAAGMDILLVGDSVGMVQLGYENTLPVTLDEILHHLKAVKRGNSRAFLVADMPYLTYHIDVKETLRHAGRLIKEGGAQAVKLEGGIEIAPMIKELNRINIPVMGHLGLTPQAVHRLGGYKVQGRKPQDAEKLLTDAKILEGAGIFSLVLECVPPSLASEITRKLSIPTIGIGAGSGCDGQILVTDDLFGLSEGPPLKFVKRYAELHDVMLQAAAAYCRDVKDGAFPSHEHEFLK